MIDYKTLSDFDVFFYYGEIDLETEVESELMAGFIQPARSFFYNRQDSCGVYEKENFPNTLSLTINMSYDIVNWAAYRNIYVTNGQNNTRDRRVAISQNSINYEKDNKGNLDATIFYIPFFNYKKPSQLTLPIIKGL